MNGNGTHWTFNRRLPIATLLALILQSAGVIWWASALSSTVSEQGRVMAEVKQFGSPITRDRLAALEAGAITYADSLRRIDSRLDTIDRKIDRLFEEGVKK